MFQATKHLHRACCPQDVFPNYFHCIHFRFSRQLIYGIPCSHLLLPWYGARTGVSGGTRGNSHENYQGSYTKRDIHVIWKMTAPTRDLQILCFNWNVSYNLTCTQNIMYTNQHKPCIFTELTSIHNSARSYSSNITSVSLLLSSILIIQ